MSIQKNGDIRDPWVLISADAALPEHSTLIVSVMDAIQPLDGQIGASRKKTVPDALHDPLFGQPRPCAVEVRRYGHEQDVPPLRTYAVLDAAKMPYLLTGLLENSDMRHACLFQGRAMDALGEHAPYLVELRVDAELTQRLFTGKAGVNGLWPLELGIYIRSRVDFDDMRKHLRRFTRVRDAAGQWFYFAFWDPGSLGWLALHGPRSFPDHLARAGVIRDIFAFSDEAHVRITQPQPSGAEEVLAPFVMDPSTWASLGQFVERRFLRRLRQECLHIADDEADAEAAFALLQSEGFRSRPVMQKLARWWSAPSGAWATRQDWAQAELSASRGLPDAIRQDRLRNLYEEKAWQMTGQRAEG